MLCGDLNTTPNNSLYDIISDQHGFQDSLKKGYGFTFPNAQRRSALFGPLIKIDYIFTRGLRTKDSRTINTSNLSDHRAVMTQVYGDRDE